MDPSETLALYLECVGSPWVLAHSFQNWQAASVAVLAHWNPAHRSPKLPAKPNGNPTQLDLQHFLAKTFALDTMAHTHALAEQNKQATRCQMVEILDT